MPLQKRATEALAAWRDGERRQDAALEGSPERQAADTEVASLRDEYQRLVDLQKQAAAREGVEDPQRSESS